jgi:8-oxo-dGTP pyrophosphatase MutT (NUDIX family)
VDARDLERLSANLPAVPGIHGRAEHFNVVVLVLLAPIDGEYHFVLQKRSPGIRQPGEICFPGGAYDATQDNSPRETALRETFEELGIPADRVRIVGVLDTMVAPAGATIDAFVGVAAIDSLDDLVISPNEVEEAFTVPVAYFEQHEPRQYFTTLRIEPSYIDSETQQEVVTFPARDLGLPERYWKPWGGIRHPVIVYQVGPRVIWGITARLIADVVQKLRQTPASETE